MEMDLFRHGDEQGAAMRMIEHLEKNITHKSSRKWTDELRNILSNGQTPPAP
jgi:predicted N-formylglutamate amidohydrolase